MHGSVSVPLVSFTCVRSHVPPQVTRILERFTAVRTLPGTASFIRTHVLNMAFQVVLICEDLAAFVACVALVIFGLTMET